MYPVSLSDAERSAIPNVHWTPDGDRGEIDSETAILLRACLRPLFERAETWAGLLAELRDHLNERLGK